MQNLVVLGSHSIFSSKKRILRDHGQKMVHRFNSCVLYFSRRLREAVEKLRARELRENFPMRLHDTKRCESASEKAEARGKVSRG